MYPLKMHPVFKHYLWGGEQLKNIYAVKNDTEPLAESWVLSCHDNGPSVIANGKYRGKTLKEYILAHPQVLGTRNQTGEFPILIKLIDAADNLSVQVHPNDEAAALLEGQRGKTEWWYVIKADKDAKLIWGVKQPTTHAALREAIENQTVISLLNTVPTAAGDSFLIEAGTIHSIGKGNLIAEIQQSSDVTYRLYDYLRLDKNGKPRELHIKKGVAVSTVTPPSPAVSAQSSCSYFTIEKLEVSGNTTLTVDNQSFVALLNVNGECRVNAVTLKQGECVFLPAGLGIVTVTGNALLLATKQP